MVTLTEPSAEERLLDMYRGDMRAVAHEELLPDTKYAAVLLKLAPGVTQGDYPALAAAITGITGIQGVTLLIDHQTRADVPDGRQLAAVFKVDLRLEPTES